MTLIYELTHNISILHNHCSTDVDFQSIRIIAFLSVEFSEESELEEYQTTYTSKLRK